MTEKFCDYQEKAAQIAGLNRRDFLAALAREQVDVFTVDFDDLGKQIMTPVELRKKGYEILVTYRSIPETRNLCQQVF